MKLVEHGLINLALGHPDAAGKFFALAPSKSTLTAYGSRCVHPGDARAHRRDQGGAPSAFNSDDCFLTMASQGRADREGPKTPDPRSGAES